MPHPPSVSVCPPRKREKIHGHVPAVHWDCVRRLDGKRHYEAEVSDAAGTHGIYLEKKKVDSGEVEVRELPARRRQGRPLAHRDSA